MKYVLMSNDFESVLCDIHDGGRVVSFDDKITADQASKNFPGVFVVDIETARNMMENFNLTVH